MSKGTHMHKLYSLPVKSFDRELLFYQIEPKKIFYAYQRSFTFEGEEILIRGIPDDYRILLCPRSQEKYVSLVELKTTGRDRLWSNEESAACLQLRIYVWLMRPLLEHLGYKLWKRHYLEVFNQASGHLIKRTAVQENPNMQAEICRIINSFRGLEPMWVPGPWACKHCPQATKQRCDWFQRMNHDDDGHH